jgi:hypothetical protein
MLHVPTFCREPASSASGRAASGMSSDEKNQVPLLGVFQFFSSELWETIEICISFCLTEPILFCSVREMLEFLCRHHAH